MRGSVAMKNDRVGEGVGAKKGAVEKALTKSDLIEEVALRANVTKDKAAMVVNCIFDSMTEALEQGDRIEVRNFGNFTVKGYKPYTGRNPKTGDLVEVPSKRMPFFKVGLELKELVNKS
jgi:integration host factor subunit beta